VFLRVFGLSAVVTVFAMVVALLHGGVSAMVLVLLLGVLEVSLSFDNAVVNATVLQHMSPFWQKMFLTVGVIVAAFGMRLLFPLLVVSVSAHLSPSDAFDLALHPPRNGATYAGILHDSTPKTAAFGGTFLLMLFLNFIFTEREITWLSWLERPLARIGRINTISVVVCLAAVVIVGGYVAHNDRADVVMAAGALGMGAYLLVQGLGNLFSDENSNRPSNFAALSGLVLFVYLELLDMSFSFDGVVGAFAVTADPIVITLGLGFVGAMFVRSFTVYLVRKGTLADYVFLEHGAHWAIGALAVVMLASVRPEWELPPIAVGSIGVGVITAAFLSSLWRNHRTRVRTQEPGLAPEMPTPDFAH
jgi:hypothetical protein